MDDHGASAVFGSYYTGFGAGSGRLEVLAGADVRVDNFTFETAGGYLQGGYNNLIFGNGPGSTGYGLVSDAGSTLIANGGGARIKVGYNGGTGELRIDNGGFVGTLDIDVGRGHTAATGTLVIDGPGSTLLASTAYGYYGAAYDGSQGFLDIGSGTAGRGYLTVSNGGTLATTDGQLRASDGWRRSHHR